MRMLYKNNQWPPQYHYANRTWSPRSANRSAGFFVGQGRRWESLSWWLTISPQFRTLYSPLLTWWKLNLKASSLLCRKKALLSTPPGRMASRSTICLAWKPSSMFQKLESNFSSWDCRKQKGERRKLALPPQDQSNQKWRRIH